MNKVAFLCPVILAASLLSGCSSDGTYSSNTSDSGFTPTVSNTTAEVTTEGLSGNTLSSGSDVTTSTDGSTSVAKTFYFDFDRYGLSESDVAQLKSHVAYLKEHPNSRIRIEGHTDERGSREYNIGLGERRGKAVKRFFELEGIGNDRVAVVSYGEEKPATDGHEETAYRMNRRAVIEYEES